MSDKVDYGHIFVVLTGYVDLKDGTEGVAFRRIKKEDDKWLSFGPESYFKRKAVKGHRVGDMIRIELANADGSSYYLATSVWIGTWADERERTGWYTQARAYDVAKREKSLMRKEQVRKLIREHMAPLNNLYVNTNYDNQMALTALVLDALQRGKGVRD